MIFCPTGTSIITTPTSSSGSVSVALTGIDPDDGVIRLQCEGSSGSYISFGNGNILLSSSITEFFRVPNGVTSVSIGTSSSSGAKISVTIGKFV